MATTFTDLKKFLAKSGLHFDAHDEAQVIAIGFSGEDDGTSYRDADGDAHVQILVRLSEGGELVSVFVPRTWQLADCEHRAAVCEAATRIQAEMKLIRFDLDDEGYLAANIEMPLEKAPMCSQQLHRAIAGILLAIRRYDPVIRHAMETGGVDLSLAKEDEPKAPTPDVLRTLELGSEAGGLDALEQLLGDGDAPPIES